MPQFERPQTESDWRNLLGRKVSLRHRLAYDPEHPFSEAIGVVQSVHGSGESFGIDVVNRRGEVVSVRLTDIEAAKVFPL